MKTAPQVVPNFHNKITSNSMNNDTNPEETAPDSNDPRRWQADGWIAQVIKNEDDDGWAVAMTKEGANEPALVGPWTMGRNKKDPKPLDKTAFSTLVKTATEFVGRQEQQLHARLNQSVTISIRGARITVTHSISPDDDNPTATLSARDELGETLATLRCEPSFKLTRERAQRWAESEFGSLTD
jgi:hypothetical protein